MTMWGEKVYVPAIMGASGITKEQAKTCFYYAIATYLIPDTLGRMPILAIIGPHGTGKTCLLNQLATMAKEPKLIGAESVPTLRDTLNNTITALIDEGDSVYESSLIKRYEISTSDIAHNVPYGSRDWRIERAKTFGATIIVRRIPFKDAATTSRSIVIRTQYKPGNYRIKKFHEAQARLSDIAGKASLLEEETSHRAWDNWMPLRAIAQYLRDTEWLDYSNEEIKKYVRVLKGSQKFEPEQALLMVLREEMTKLVSGTETVITGNVLLSEIRKELRSEFDRYLNNTQIEEICRAWGFTVVSHSGYPKVKHNHKLLLKLCKERKL